LKSKQVKMACVCKQFESLIETIVISEDDDGTSSEGSQQFETFDDDEEDVIIISDDEEDLDVDEESIDEESGIENTNHASKWEAEMREVINLFKENIDHQIQHYTLMNRVWQESPYVEETIIASIVSGEQAIFDD
jgi:hypothetical protein